VIFNVWLVFLYYEHHCLNDPGSAVLLITSQGARSGVRGVFSAQSGFARPYFLLFSFFPGTGCRSAQRSSAFFYREIVRCRIFDRHRVQNILSSFKNPGRSSCRRADGLRNNRTHFLQAFATQISNPKAILFFTSLVPQFINPAGNIPFPIFTSCGNRRDSRDFYTDRIRLAGRPGRKNDADNPLLPLDRQGLRSHSYCYRSASYFFSRTGKFSVLVARK